MVTTRRKLSLFIAYSVATLATFFVGFMPIASFAATVQRSPEVKVYRSDNGTYVQQTSFTAYDSGFMGGGTVAIGNVGKDNKNEIVTGAGTGGAPHIRVFKVNGQFQKQFYAYNKSMTSGVNVAVGDVDGDGKAEIITAPKKGGGPQVRVFTSSGKIKMTPGFFAYDEASRNGVNVAVGDVDGDGKAEIVTGNGPDSIPLVRVFDGDGTAHDGDLHPFPDSFKGGVTVAVGNVDGGKESEIITAVQSRDETWVKVYKYNDARTVLGEWKVYTNGFRGGINVAAGDVDGDGEAEVITTVQGNGGPQVMLFEAFGKQINPGFFAYESEFHGGVSVAVGNTNNSDSEEIIVIPSKQEATGRTDVERYVKVDLSEQRLYAYENGNQVNSFLISSGLSRTPTPTGEFHIQRKLYSHLYAGPGYYLPNTLYNLQFAPHYYLHGAYWHNNFGQPMSHGCVNIHYNDAAWLFDWLQVGDLTVIQP